MCITLRIWNSRKVLYERFRSSAVDMMKKPCDDLNKMPKGPAFSNNTEDEEYLCQNMRALYGLRVSGTLLLF